MTPYDFEQKMKFYITQAGRTQAATARLLNIAPDTFNKWVRGINRIPIDVLHEFCELHELGETERDELFKLAGYVVSPVINETTSDSLEQADVPVYPVPLPRKRYRELVGRDTILDDILAALQDPVGKRMLAVDGMGGIGKTAIAREVVDRCLTAQLFDVAVWIQAPKEEFTGLNRPKKTGSLTFETALNDIARQLGAADVFKLRGAEKTARLHTLLQMQPVIIVLDNLETAKEPQNDIAHRLSPLLGVSKAILTSRQRFQADVYAIHLTGLDETSSLDFIRQEANEKNIKRVAAAEPTELKQIAKATGGSPLALKLVVGQLESLDLDTVLTLLTDAQMPEQGSEEDEYFRFYQGIFFSSWRLLSETSKKLLISMTHFAPGVGGSLEAIEATSELDKSTLARSVRELWQFSFLEVDTSPTLKQLRYYLHTLTQYFVLADIVRII